MLLFSQGGRYASNGMRGGQISHKLTGDYNKCILNDANVSNQTIILLKDFVKNLDLIKHLKNNNNKLILDVIDLLDVSKYDSKNNINIPNFLPYIPTEYIDGYIVNSNKMGEWWFDKIDKKPIFVIPHHWEDSFYNLPIKQYEHQPYFYYLGYIGHEEQNCLYINKLLEDKLLQEHRFDSTNEGYYKDKPVNGCQINIRIENSWEYCFKPATKLSVASAMDSLMITTYDWAIQDLLPPEYPFLLTNTDYQSVKNMFKKVKDSFEKDEWFAAKEMLDYVKQETSLDTLINKYKELDKYFSLL